MVCAILRGKFLTGTSTPRQLLVDQAAEFAFFGELLRLVRGFVEQGDGLAEGGGAFLAAGGVVRLRQRRTPKRGL